MDDSGNIKRFAEMSQAIKEGYKHSLTENEAEYLKDVPNEERLAELAFKRHYEEKDFKMDTISKLKYKRAFIEGYKYARNAK